MSLIGKNIKKIRNIKKLNQSDFAKLFDVSRASVGSYEEGRAEPKIDKIIEIANYFSIDLNLLLKKELTVNEISGFKLTDSKMLNEKGNNLISKRDTKTQRIIYIDNNSISDFINYTITKNTWEGKYIDLPPSVDSKTCLAFVHNDNAMNINSEGIAMADLVFAESIDFDNLFNNYTYIVVVEDYLYLRKVQINGDVIVLTSVNPNFQPIIIGREKVIAFYKLNAVIKKTINHFLK